MSYTTRKTCRVCGSSNLTYLFGLGDHCVSNFVAKEELGKAEKIPIDLEICGHCSLVQLKHTAPQEILYSQHYWYRSGVTQTMRDALKDVTKDIENYIDLKSDDVVLDIGSNDGTLLRSYSSELQLRKVGVEPAINLEAVGREGVDVFISDFWDYSIYQSVVPKKAKVITAIGMFYDLEDPNQFIADIRKALHPDGLFVAQLMCLQNMININDVGNLCHEHLEFYSLTSLRYLLQTHDLEMFDIATNQVNGESYRVYIRPCKGTVKSKPGAGQRLLQAFTQEFETGLHRPEFYKQFFDTMEENKKRLLDFIELAKATWKRIWIYGASTKGNTILQYYGLDYTLIDGAAERSPEKYGLYTVGTGIPIYSEAEAREHNPDYFLVLPYTFLNEFIKREKVWRDGGGRFLVPLPMFRVV